jgi:hypothetical protein
MADTFTPGEMLFAPNGRKVEFVAPFDGGFLVKRRTVFYENDEEYESFNEAAVETKLFRKPPVAKFADEVTALTATAATLKAEIAQLKQQRLEDQRVGKEFLDRCARHSQLSRLADFIDGKITHVVTLQYGSVIISTFAEAFQIMEGRYHLRWDGKSLKLLTLFGDTKGNLQWQINSYTDSSGSGRETYPCCSEQEAKETAARVVASRWDDVRKHPWQDPATNTINSADALGLEVPADVRQIVRQSKIDNKRSHIASSQESLNKLVADLAAMESAS